MDRLNFFTIMLVIFFLFMCGSIMGWVLELFYRRFFSDKNPEKRWINPGFLVGPCLPLYGFGLIALFVMSLIPAFYYDELTVSRVLIIIVIMGLVMTIIEYISGIIFIKGLHVKLWDYSTRKFNIQGIICPTFSIIWTLLGAVYYFFIQPRILKMVIWFTNNIAFSFFVGIFAGIFIIDIVYSFNLVTTIKKYASEHNIVVKYDELKNHIRNKAQEEKEIVHFLFAFKTEKSFLIHLKSYIDMQIDFIEKDIEYHRDILEENIKNKRNKR